MNGFPGKFIVIDGTDGSGKTTQLNLLKLKLEADGHAVEVADFPQYNTKSAGLVEEYLSGKYGQADDVNAYKASIFYAVDRYDASFKIRKWLTEGKIVLSNRYTSANMGHQGCKIENPLERRVFFNWLYDLEYKIFEIPKPDLSIILHVEAEVSQQLAKNRGREDWTGKTHDIHEENIDHLRKAERVYSEIADTFPDFKLISCTRVGELLKPEEIHFLVYLAVQRAISDRAKPSGDFQAISSILGSNQQIVNNREIFFERRENKKDSFVPDDTELMAAASEPVQKPATVTKLIAQKINDQAKLPSKAHRGDAGFDLYANDYYSINPYGQALVSTGIRLAIPDGYVGLIWDKSGLASQGFKTMGGVIDSSYRGEIKVVFKNLSEDIYNIVPGQKVAQILIQEADDWQISEGEVEIDGPRGEGAFGSTGQF